MCQDWTEVKAACIQVSPQPQQPAGRRFSPIEQGPSPMSHWLSVLPAARPALLGLGLTALALGAGCSQLQSAAEPSYEAQLASHLTSSGAKMYGAYWCPHCAEQKELFADGAKQLPYIECDRNGENPQAQLCADKGVQGYPTWEINGQLYPGTQSIDTLANLSGYPLPPAPSAP